MLLKWEKATEKQKTKENKIQTKKFTHLSTEFNFKNGYLKQTLYKEKQKAKFQEYKLKPGWEITNNARIAKVSWQDQVLAKICSKLVQPYRKSSIL